MDKFNEYADQPMPDGVMEQARTFRDVLAGLSVENRKTVVDELLEPFCLHCLKTLGNRPCFCRNDD